MVRCVADGKMYIDMKWIVVDGQMYSRYIVDGKNST